MADGGGSPGSTAAKLVSWLSQKIGTRIEGIGFSPSQVPQDPASAIPEELSAREKVDQFAESGSAGQRVFVVSNFLAEAASAAPSVEDVETNLVPMVERLAHDAEASVRQTVAEVIPGVARAFQECGEEVFTRNVLHILLPLVAELTTDESPQARASASQSLVRMARDTIAQEHLLPYVLPIIRSLSKDKTEEEHRVQAAILFHSLAPTFGAEVVSTYVVSCVVTLAADPQFRVRKVVAGNLHIIADVVGPADALNALLAAFLTLVNDDIWGVRKACCESLVALARHCDARVRATQLVPAFEQLVEDTSRWVRAAAYSVLGPLIATFVAPEERVDPKLLVLFKTMPHPLQQGRDGDLSLDCAFNLPGVLQTLGGERWEELRELHAHLSKDLQWQVRRTLAHSLHEVARIIGPERTEASLLPIFDAFMDDLEEVKVGVVKHLAGFFAALSPQERTRHSQLILKLQRDTINWRFRELLALQLVPLVGLYEEEELPLALVPAALGLCMDKVTSVRNAAVQGMAHLLVSVNGELRASLVEEVTKWVSGNFHSRKTFARLVGCLRALGGDELPELTQILFELVSDKVPNVRLVVAQQLLANKEALGARAEEALALLANDEDYDVRLCAGAEWVNFPQREKKNKKKPTQQQTNK